jgi:hypothetical protein
MLWSDIQNARKSVAETSRRAAILATKSAILGTTAPLAINPVPLDATIASAQRYARSHALLAPNLASGAAHIKKMYVSFHVLLLAA